MTLWHLALEGPTVVINVDSHIVAEAVRYHQAQYADVYRTEAALTVALMGLLTEEALIAQRLGEFGRKTG